MLSAPGMVPAAASSRDLTSMSRAWPEARSERSSGSETVGAEEGGTRALSGAGCPARPRGAPPPGCAPARGRGRADPGAAPRRCTSSRGSAGRSGRGPRFVPAGTSGHGARRHDEPQEYGPRPPPRCPQHLPRPPGAGTGTGSGGPAPAAPVGGYQPAGDIFAIAPHGRG